MIKIADWHKEGKELVIQFEDGISERYYATQHKLPALRALIAEYTQIPQDATIEQCLDVLCARGD